MADNKHTLNSLQAQYASDSDDQAAETATDPAVRVAAFKLAESGDLAPGTQANANDVSEEIISSYEFRALSQTVTVTFASA